LTDFTDQPRDCQGQTIRIYVQFLARYVRIPKILRIGSELSVLDWTNTINNISHIFTTKFIVKHYNTTVS
jgi:hypothetical protein